METEFARIVLRGLLVILGSGIVILILAYILVHLMSGVGEETKIISKDDGYRPSLQSIFDNRQRDARKKSVYNGNRGSRRK